MCVFYLHFVFDQVPLLEKGDIIIDGGNSEYSDTNVSHEQSTMSRRFLSIHQNRQTCNQN